MKKYIVYVLVVSMFLINLSFITPKALASDMSIRDFINLLVTIGVITTDKMPAVNTFLATLDNNVSSTSIQANVVSVVVNTAINSSANNTSPYIDLNSFVVSNSSEPFITILSPNGGESFNQGGMIFGVFGTNFPKDTFINISLVDSSGYDRNISSSVVRPTNNKTNFSFSLPSDILPGKYKLRVARSTVTASGASACKTGCLQDLSDNYFDIVSPSSKPIISLSYPNGGEIFNEGDKITIKWNSQDISNLQKIDINLWMPHGTGNIGKNIAFDAPNTGVYDWTVKAVQSFSESELNSVVSPTGQYKIGISCKRIDPNCNFILNNDSSDDYFTIN
jgi:hypothetical protein